MRNVDTIYNNWTIDNITIRKSTEINKSTEIEGLCFKISKGKIVEKVC